MVPITKTQVYARGDGKNTLGYAHITLGDTFVVKNLRIVKGKKGVFVGMPSNRNRRGEYIDIFFPISQEARDYLTRTVIESFRKEFPQLMEGLTIYGLEEPPGEGKG
ncbi:MAG: SpoVG family protein [Leptospiraceae bacterium]|nr:SpoVG family protein [Leptospiraceae bacterium]MDW8306856.1 SpoVG family protein [Leptospiraceae bacterium]